MDAALQSSLAAAWSTLPEDVRSTPATEEQLREFETSFGSVPADFRWFLRKCGGGPVGSEWVDDIDELAEIHRKFIAESGPNGWKMVDVFVIGWDGGGNPFGIHRPSGKVLVEDHDFGGIHELAESFAAFLARGLGFASQPPNNATP
jgi:hypothetical protein